MGPFVSQVGHALTAAMLGPALVAQAVALLTPPSSACASASPTPSPSADCSEAVAAVLAHCCAVGGPQEVGARAAHAPGVGPVLLAALVT